MEMQERIMRTTSCRDCDSIPKVPDAGMIIGGDPQLQIMHNGVKIIKGAYHGDWMTEIIKNLRGHHEPQEEKIFHEVLQTLPEKATMIELGCFWAYYSLWFNKAIKDPVNYLIEPIPYKLEVGKKHFEVNNMKGLFLNAFLGKDSDLDAVFTDWDGTQYRIPRIGVDDFIESTNILFADIVHADIQGAEYEMLVGCRRSIEQNKIGYFFISTHGNMHSKCLDFLREHDFTIIAQHTIEESVSDDGLIVAKSPAATKVKLSTAGAVQYYSQIGQDRILDTELFRGKENGFFVDVGATDGYHFSNTLFFEKWRKWQGICIEPNPIEFAKLHESERISIKENYAISSGEGETEFLAIDGYGKGLSGIISSYDPRHIQRIEQEIKGHDSKKHIYKVKTIPLQKLFDLHNIVYVDYCSIDVEGAELQVLESIDFDKTYIKCFSIENNYGLERETKLLESKGYRLWKRLAFDDFFVKMDIPRSSRSNSHEHIKPTTVPIEFVRKRINAHHAAFLPMDQPVIMEDVEAESLLTWMRFDIMAKYIYAMNREMGINSNWAYELYDAHEKAFNNYDEKDGSGKKGIKDFIDSFNQTLDSIKQSGFDTEVSSVPVSYSNNLIDGSHRVAACLFYRRPVNVLRFNFEGWYYNFDFFRKRGLDEKYLDAMAYEYCKLKPNTYLVLLFPSALGRDDDVINILLDCSSIVYEKEVRLSGNGPLLLMTQVYRNESWLGDMSNNFAGARLKAAECFKGDSPLRVFVIETDTSEKLKEAKEKIRDIYKISNHSVHINDSHEETLQVGQVLFNWNSIHFLNHAQLQFFSAFKKNYGFYRSLLKETGVDKESFCITGSAVLAMYGIRDARDIDYLHFKEALPGPSEVIGSHNKEERYYTVHRDDIIFDPENHFYFDGLKFASLEIIRKMKQKRGESKDIRDIELINSVAGEKEKKTGGTVGIIFSKDRAMQLDATLRSLFLHCNDIDSVKLVVLYKTTNDFFERQYQFLRINYSKVRFMQETDFKSDLVSAIENFDNVLFLVDDNIFTNDFSIEEAVLSLNNKPEAVGFSLRLGKNITYSYMLNREHQIPQFYSFNNSIIGYDWTSVDGGFGYPLEVSSSIYRVSDMLSLMHQEQFNNPNTLEAVMDAGKARYRDKRRELLCFERSVTFCNPVNKVQNIFDNRSGSIAANSPESLGELFDKGYRVDVSRYAGMQVNSYHTEAEMYFLREDEGGLRTSLVSIVILNYNGMKHLKPCLDSIRRNTPESHEIIVFDNASTDGSREYLRLRKDILLIESPENIGCPPARAKAMAVAKGDFLIFLDNDTVVTSGWVSRFLRHAEKDPKIGMMGPCSNYVSGQQLVCDVPYRDTSELEQFADDFSRRNSGQLAETIRLVGFCMFVRREVIDKIGSIDASFGRFGFEDDDYTWRAHIAGFTAAIAKDIFIHHTGGPQGRGDHGYNQLLLDAWSVFRKKWGLPSELEYGSQVDPEMILAMPFEKTKHYIPLADRAEIEGMIYVDTSDKVKKNAVHNSIERSREYYYKGRIDKAIEKLIDLIKISPDDREIYYTMAEIFIDSRQFKEALDTLNSLSERAKNYAGSLELFGYCSEGLGMDEEAEKYADRALEINNASPAALNLKGVLAYKKGDRKAAEELFSKAIESDPGYGEAYANKGVILWSEGNREAGLDNLERGVVLSPMVSDVLSLYQNAVSASGEFERAEKVLVQVQRAHPFHKNIFFSYISMLLQQEKYQEAMAEIEQAIITFGIDDGILSSALQVRDRVGPLDTVQENKNTLSVCMIVKNEEEYIAKCLMSVKPFSNEVIVVDTGSSDGTKGIARAFGAKVYDFKWTDDFAEARNYSLSLATCEWILVVDADEVISPLDHDLIKGLIIKKDDRPVAYDLVTRNYTTRMNVEGWNPNEGRYASEEAGNGWYPSAKVRLFRNDKRIRFVNPVHECVESTIIDAGIEIKPCAVPIHHYGRLGSPEKIRAKGEAYYLLGKKKLEKNADDPKALYELAAAAGELERYEEAVDLWERFIALDPKVATAFLSLGAAYMKLNRYADAFEASKKAFELNPDLKEAACNYASCLIWCDDVKKAIPILEKALQKFPDYISAICLAAAAYLIDGAIDKGRNCLDILREKGCDTSSYFTDHVRILRSLGRHEYAESLLESIVKAGHGAEQVTGLIE